MNQFRSLSRRALAIAASAFIGLVGAVAIASPASAHHPIVNGETTCADPETGEWTVTWTVTSSNDAEQYKITELESDSDAEVTGIPLNEFRPISESFTGEQVLPASAESVTLTVHAEWNNGVQEKAEGGPVYRPEKCEVEEPAPVEVDSMPACDGLTVKVSNPDEGEDVEVTLSPSTGDAVTESLAAGESAEHSFDAGEDGLAVEVGVNGEEFSVITWEEPEDCDADGGGGGDLPETGASTGIAVGGALLLLALGTGLFFMARRRRITFTA